MFAGAESTLWLILWKKCVCWCVFSYWFHCFWFCLLKTVSVDLSSFSCPCVSFFSKQANRNKRFKMAGEDNAKTSLSGNVLQMKVKSNWGYALKCCLKKSERFIYLNSWIEFSKIYTTFLSFRQIYTSTDKTSSCINTPFMLTNNQQFSLGLGLLELNQRTMQVS